MSWTNTDLVDVRTVFGERGLFARTAIAPGVIIGVFDGVADVFTIGPDDTVDWRGQDGAMSIHLKVLGDRLYALMPHPQGPVDGIDFINHSCRPNCRTVAGMMVVETLRPIVAGEHLTLNYHAMDLIKLGRPCWCADVAEAERCIL